MIELFIAILALWNVQALPSVQNTAFERTDEFEHCVRVQEDNAHAFSRCVSMQHPLKTFHIFNTNHCNPYECERTERINLFIKNGDVFEIPEEELFDFYNINIETK